MRLTPTIYPPIRQPELQRKRFGSGPTAAADGSAGLGNSIQTLDLYGRLGATGCADTTTEVGITSTPVIQLTSNVAPKQGVIFVVAKSLTNGQVNNTLFALRLADGKPLGPGVQIQGTVTGPNGTITYDGLHEFNRPALLLDQEHPLRGVCGPL